MQNVTVNIIPVEDDQELYRHYNGQTEQQTCAVTLDLEDGDLGAEYNAGIGNGIPVSVFHRRVLAWKIGTLTAKTANALLEEIAPLAQKIIDDAEIEWNGNNHVGVFGPDANEAVEAIEALCANYRVNQVVTADVDDWYPCTQDAIDDCELTAYTTDAEIEAHAERAASEALNADYAVMILDSELVAARLTELREGLREELREELRDATAEVAEVEESLKVVTGARNTLIARVARFDSLRDVAELADVSHQTVANISRK